MIIRPMTVDDAARVIDIYGRAMTSGHATFQSEPGTWESWDAGHLAECRLVACDGDGGGVGWAGLWRDVMLLQRRSTVVGVE